MKKRITFLEMLKEPAVQIYLLGCLLSLGLIAMIEMSRAVPELVLLTPVLLVLGLLGMFAQFGSVPMMMLVTVGGGELWARHGSARYSSGGVLLLEILAPLDVLLCLTFVVHLLCQFRLHALTLHLFPRDPRKRREPAPERPEPYRRRPILVQRRAPATFDPWEPGILFLVLVLCVAAALLFWFRLMAPPHFYDFSPAMDRLALVLWIIFIPAALASAALAWWRWQAWSTEEALLVLQDTYWRETRREQRRQYRWLAWARRYGKYRKGKP